MPDLLNQKLADNNKPAWIWGPLAFSSFYYLPLIFNFSSFTITNIVISVVIYLIFIALYAKAVFSCGEKALLPLIAMLLLCVFGTAITPGTQSLFGFIAYFLGFNFNVKKALLGLATLIVSIFLSAILFDFYQGYFIAPAILISFGLIFFGRAERQDRIHRQKENLSQEKVEQLAAIAERERIARDLHDLIGHSLTSIALKADLAEKLALADKMSQAKQEIYAVAQLSRTMLNEIRQAVSGLNDKTLSTLLKTLKKELEQHQFSVKITNELTNVSADIEANLVLILTEATTNILRHSNGNTVTITLKQQDNKIMLTINDNGKTSGYKQGNGLTGMLERCQYLQGSLNINHQRKRVINPTFQY
jgi:two-component system, NarL family, sensor histidine kinase DesK